MNKCKCGCGAMVKNKYARGHNVKKQNAILVCYGCGMKSKNMKLFVRDRRLSSGRKNLCKKCQNQINRKLIEINDDIIKRAKGVPCKRCGKEYPDYVMDFHHRTPSEKTLAIGRSKLISTNRLLKEIEKCDVYCANCHRFIENNIVEPIEGSKMHLLPPSDARSNLRSITPQGFAKAVFETNTSHNQ